MLELAFRNGGHFRSCDQFSFTAHQESYILSFQNMSGLRGLRLPEHGETTI